MITLTNIVTIFIGGGIGALLRWFLALLSLSLKLGPWIGTLFANVIGCLLIFLFVKNQVKDISSLSLAYKVGFLGGLTTFSGFALEVVSSFTAGRYQESALILFSNILLGIIIGFIILR